MSTSHPGETLTDHELANFLRATGNLIEQPKREPLGKTLIYWVLWPIFLIEVSFFLFMLIELFQLGAGH